jgi:outer membrane protein assembly factor BamB/predicted phosphodiesterase
VLCCNHLTAGRLGNLEFAFITGIGMALSQINGRVYDASSSRGIEEISVSNGDSIARTDADGRYSLAIEPLQDRYVFISVPEGYRPQERFYALIGDEPIGESLDFPLIPAPERAQGTFRLAHVSDTHVVNDDSGAVSQEVLAQDLKELVAGAAPDLVVVTGDLTNMGTVPELESYRAAIESVPIPVFSVFGGHDGNIERRSTAADTPCTRNFEATLGPTYYSFDWGGYHFVIYATEGSYFSAADRARKERWLVADLALQPSDRQSVLMLHTAPDEGLLAKFSRHNGALVLHGHWHSSRVFNFGETVVASSSSFCFGGIDTRPRGCRLVSFSPQGIRTALHARVRTAKGKSESNYSTQPQPARQAPARVTLGEQTLSLAWKHEFESPLHRAAPVYYQGSVLISLQSESYPSRSGITCIDLESGAERWHYPTDAAIKNSCAVVAGNGKDWCAALTVTGQLHLIDLASGDCEWTVELPAHPLRWVYSSPAYNGTSIFAGSKAGYGAYGLEAGKQEWHVAPSGGDEWPSYICPQIYKNDLCIVLVQRRGFLALDMSDGRIVWEQDLPVEYFCASPVLAGDLVVVGPASPHTGASLTGGQQGDLAVLEAATGEIVAHFPRALPGYATGISVAEDRIYTATAAGSVHCHELHTGTPLWQFQAGDDLLDMTPYRRAIQSLLAAPVPLHGHVLVGGCDGWLYVLDSTTGACTDRVNLGAPITAPPRITPDGFCVGTHAGTLYSYRSERKP